MFVLTSLLTGLVIGLIVFELLELRRPAMTPRAA